MLNPPEYSDNEQRLAISIYAVKLQNKNQQSYTEKKNHLASYC